MNTYVVDCGELVHLLFLPKCVTIKGCFQQRSTPSHKRCQSAAQTQYVDGDNEAFLVKKVGGWQLKCDSQFKQRKPKIYHDKAAGAIARETHPPVNPKKLLQPRYYLIITFTPRPTLKPMQSPNESHIICIYFLLPFLWVNYNLYMGMTRPDLILKFYHIFFDNAFHKSFCRRK